MVDQNYLLVQWEYWGCQNNGQSSQTLTHSLSVCPGKNVNFKLLPCQEQEDNLLTYRISKYRGRKSKGKSPSGALLLISCLLPRKGQRKEPANKISFFFPSFQKRAKSTSRRSPPCTRRGAPRLMPTSIAVASCTWWWRTGQQSWSPRPRWLWTPWQHDARRRTASWRSGLVKWDWCVCTAGLAV